MKRKPFIAGNWKMYKNRDEALEFIYQVNEKLPSNDLVETAICAPGVYLRDLIKRQGDSLRIGAQNMHHLDEGAYTGEVAARMLRSEEHTSELQSRPHLVCRLLLEKK